MKRTFQGSADEFDYTLNMANCLIFLSQGRGFDAVNGVNRVFECKTCNRQFPSFQALGGHRASHKKPRLTEGNTPSMKPNNKTHECSVCGLEFAIGQALGGHMRRHRQQGNHDEKLLSAALSLSDTTPPLVKKKANSTRVLCFDLNLTPHENDLEFYKLVSGNKATESLADLKKPKADLLICS